MTADDDLVKQLNRVVGRMTRWGLSPSIAAAVSATVNGPAEFPGRWRAEADRWSAKATQAAGEGHAVTAAGWFRQAYYCNRVAEFYYTVDCDAKTEAYNAALQAFEGAAGADTQLRRVEVDHDGRRYPGLLLTPAGASADSPVPACLAVYGADGTKEDHYWATMRPLVDRGIAVLVVDGPGQGWARRIGRAPAIAAYEGFGASCLDVLAAHPDIDADRMVLWGSSMGGYYAPRLFQADRRVRACLLNSAVYDVLTGIWDFYPPIRRQLAYNIGIESLDEAREAYKDFTLEPVWGVQDRPLCVYHGVEDNMVRLEQAERMCREAGPLAEFVAYPGAGHNLGNVSDDSHPRMWDWLADQARGAGR